MPNTSESLAEAPCAEHEGWTFKWGQYCTVERRGSHNRGGEYSASITFSICIPKGAAVPEEAFLCHGIKTPNLEKFAENWTQARFGSVPVHPAIESMATSCMFSRPSHDHHGWFSFRVWASSKKAKEIAPRSWLFAFVERIIGDPLTMLREFKPRYDACIEALRVGLAREKLSRQVNALGWNRSSRILKQAENAIQFQVRLAALEQELRDQIAKIMEIPDPEFDECALKAGYPDKAVELAHKFASRFPPHIGAGLFPNRDESPVKPEDVDVV